jgi:hypothetical protein
MKITEMPYGLRIDDDELFPEVSICILGSTGQSGHCSLVVTMMAVDGGIHGVSEVVWWKPYGTLLFVDTLSDIRKALSIIKKSFRSGEKFLNSKDIREIEYAWLQIWSV